MSLSVASVCLSVWLSGCRSVRLCVCVETEREIGELRRGVTGGTKRGRYDKDQSLPPLGGLSDANERCAGRDDDRL